MLAKTPPPLSRCSIVLFVRDTSNELQIWSFRWHENLLQHETSGEDKQTEPRRELKGKKRRHSKEQQQASHSTHTWRGKIRVSCIYSVISLASFLLVGESVSAVITSQVMKGMAQLRSTRCYHVIHLRLAAKLEMQLTISAFCLSAPHMLWRKRGGGGQNKRQLQAAPLIHRLA